MEMTYLGEEMIYMEWEDLGSWNGIVMPWIILINIKSARLLLLLHTNFVGFTLVGSHVVG